MSWMEAAKAVRALALADNGVGGLFPVSNPLLNAWYTDFAPQRDESQADNLFPYVVFSLVSAEPQLGFDSDAALLTCQISLWFDRDRAGLDAETAMDRIWTVLHRVAPSPTGYTMSKGLMGMASTVLPDELAIQHIREIEYLITKD